MSNSSKFFKKSIKKHGLKKAIKKTIKRKIFRYRYNVFKNDGHKKILEIYGVQRSGNHASIHWIISNCKDTILFCNDIQPSKLPIDATIEEFHPGNKTRSLFNSYENVLTEKIESKPSTSECGDFEKNTKVLILRDPFNLFASWYNWDRKNGQKFRNDKVYQEEIVALWKDNARLFLKWKNEDSSSKIAFNFYKWNHSPEYRVELSKKMGIAISSEKIDKTPQYGGGSSFNDTTSKSSVSSRFLKFQNEEAFIEIFKDSEIFELADKIFGEVPDTAFLRN
jgi:hypothetical protein